MYTCDYLGLQFDRIVRRRREHVLSWQIPVRHLAVRSAAVLGGLDFRHYRQ